MNRLLTAVPVLALLAACGDGQPFFADEDETETETAADSETGDATDPTDGVDATALPPGTAEPTADDSIVRYEPADGNGGLIISPVEYDAATDTFTVDNIAFDGANTYQRGAAVSSMGGYAVYDADVAVTDPLTGNAVTQIVPYRAILGLSRNTATDSDGNTVPRSSFAIVRTGGYVQYGFGGFVYEREGGVVLPDTGQATFAGTYGGMRVFDGRGGLEFTRADMTMEIDFEDFNANEGIKGVVYNREAFDATGTPIDSTTLPLPPIRFIVEEGGRGIDDNGEATGGVFSNRTVGGVLEEYETGTYYAVVSGDLTDPVDGGEITGILVLTSDDPRFSVPVQETGGFILYR